MDKATVRARIRASRRARPEADRLRAADAIADHVRRLLPATPIDLTAYRSLPAEPGTAALLAALAELGHAVWLPRIAGADLTWVRVDATPRYIAGPMGIEEPDGPAVLEFPAVSVTLLPGLAADHDGWRLGQGGGFYDRALSTVPSHEHGGPLRVLLLHDDEVLDTVPREPHDCRVDVIITPSGVLRTTSA